jgi:hypothetical protein
LQFVYLDVPLFYHMCFWFREKQSDQEPSFHHQVLMQSGVEFACPGQLQYIAAEVSRLMMARFQEKGQCVQECCSLKAECSPSKLVCICVCLHTTQLQRECT